MYPKAVGVERRGMGGPAGTLSHGFIPNGWTAASDDPDAGWKGRGIWATISTRAPFHMEGGKGTTSKVYHFQMRPDPLAIDDIKSSPF